MTWWRGHLVLTVSRVSLAAAAVIAGLRLLTPLPLELLDAKVLDLRHTLRGPLPAGDDLVIVSVDERSLAAVGRWPWPRARLAELVERLTASGAAVIGFDLVFDQPDTGFDPAALRAAAEGEPDLRARELLARLAPGLDNDARFAAAMQASGRVVLGQFFDFARSAGRTAADASRVAFPELSVHMAADGHAGPLPQASWLHPNIEVLARAAASIGHLNFIPDADGAYRRAPLAIRVGDRLAPALVLEVVRRYLGGAPATMLIAPNGAAGLRVGPATVPVDEAGELGINYLGPPGTFPTVSATDVLAGRVPSRLVEGRIALVAVTATGFDALSTPFAPVVAGVEVHATVIDNVLRGRSLERPGWLVEAEAGLVLVLGLLVGLALRWLHAAAGVTVALALTAFYLWETQHLFATRGLVLSAVYPAGGLVLSTLAGAVFQYTTEARERRKVRDAFRHYLNPEVTELLAREPERLRLGGERREITIFFSDIRGFTTISEGLPPETLGELLNDYLGAMTDIVFRHQGLLDKYIGDAVMAFWGAPLAASDHAARCCRAALDMLATLPALHARWRARGWPLLEIGIGIDTGEAVVGNFGSAQRFGYTAMGDHVNLASRLEGLNKVYGTRVLVSETTRQAVGEEFVWREVDRVRVKGKTRPVAIHELLGRRVDDHDGRWRRLEEAFARVVAAYRARAWDDAIARLERVAAEHPGDTPAALYLERCRALRAAPPDEEWDGVYEAKTK